MAKLNKTPPQVPVVLISLVLWASFAWGLPAGTEVTEGDAEFAAADLWAGVRISDAYDYAKCPECGKKNDIRALVCSRCGRVLPQPSAEIKDPDLVFVPGKGYYREGELLEPAREQKSLITTGYVIMGVGVATAAVTGYIETQKGSSVGTATGFFVASLIAVGGVPFLVLGYATRREAVYALSGSRCEPYGRPAFARASPDSDDVAVKVEVTALSF